LIYKIEKNGMGGYCDQYMGKEKFLEGFGEETVERRKCL
jgi:hypothetical protein